MEDKRLQRYCEQRKPSGLSRTTVDSSLLWPSTVVTLLVKGGSWWSGCSGRLRVLMHLDDSELIMHVAKMGLNIIHTGLLQTEQHVWILEHLILLICKKQTNNLQKQPFEPK